MQDQTGTLLAMSVLNLGLGALAWKYRNSFLAGFHEAFLRNFEQNLPWALWYARLIVRGQRFIIKLAAVLWLVGGSVATVLLLLELAGVSLLG